MHINLGPRRDQTCSSLANAFQLHTVQFENELLSVCYPTCSASRRPDRPGQAYPIPWQGVCKQSRHVRRGISALLYFGIPSLLRTFPHPRGLVLGFLFLESCIHDVYMLSGSTRCFSSDNNLSFSAPSMKTSLSPSYVGSQNERRSFSVGDRIRMT